ncbi:hypothetical protein VTO42DRAFT_5224 [Malbranchea cinnamomea]
MQVGQSDCVQAWKPQPPQKLLKWTTIAGYPTAVQSTTAPKNIEAPKTQKGIAPNCNKYHLVGAGGTCDKITERYDVNLEDFYEWNPSVGEGCKSLWTGYGVCVEVSSRTIFHRAAPVNHASDDDRVNKIVARQDPKMPGTVTASCGKYHKFRRGVTA